MAREAAKLTHEQMRLGIVRLRKALEDVRRFDPSKVEDQYNVPEIPRLSAAVDEALVLTFGTNTSDYERYRRPTDLARRITVGPFLPIEQVRAEFSRVRARSIGLLEQAICGLEDRLGEIAVASPLNQALPDTATKQSVDMLTLKPTLWGISIDLKELARRIRTWWNKRAER